ncbi:MAG: RES family NAD+ phosphorylase [Microthrixaceae bacterium]|nr:RES family NAD+ phosphorylase [Microthrixaceae bacterium]
MAAAPRRRIIGSWWHQGPTRHPLTSCANPARGSGRYHRQDEPGVWYASNQEQAAWAELFRHFTEGGIDPFELRRRVGRVSVDVEVLDLTSSTVQKSIGINAGDLLSDDYAVTQDVAAAARDAGFDAVLAPAAALPDRETLAVFAHALAKVHPERSAIRQPPPRLADLLPLIRPHERVPDVVRRAYFTIAGTGAEAIRRRRK